MFDHDDKAGGGEDKSEKGRAAGPRCPICGAPADPRHKPFCSRRCADVDLHRWLAGVYRVPGREKPKDEEGT